MKKIIHCTIGLFLLASANVFAGQISEGIWQQTSSTAGDCPDCSIEITKQAPHIFEIKSNNGWIGYAYYIQSVDKYKGAMEWKSGKGGAYENHVFLIELTYEGNTLTKHAHGTKLDFSTTYRKK